MEDLKDKYIGLDDYILIPALLKKFPYPLQKKIIKSMFKIDDKDKSKHNPMIPVGITNVGRITLDGFENATIENAHFIVPISYPPFFSLEVDSFGETITFSTAYCRKDKNDRTIENFFNLIFENLPK